MNTLTKQLHTEVKDISEETREMTFVISSEAVDRDGDVIKVGGWKLDNFMKNPVFLTFHDQYQFPIGRFSAIWPDGEKLLGRVKFANKGTYPVADIAYELYQQGIMNAVSVSFAGLNYEPNEKTGGLVFNESELFEVSAVPVPANPEAVAVSRKANQKLRELLEAQPDASAQDDAKEATEAINAMIKTLEEALHG